MMNIKTWNDMALVNAEMVNAMTVAERVALRDRCNKILDADISDSRYMLVFGVWCLLNEALVGAKYPHKLVTDKDMYSFYREHVAGHSDEEFKLGEQVADECYDFHCELPAEVRARVNYVFDSALDRVYMQMFCKKHPEVSVRKAHTAYRAYMARDAYIEWEKDSRYDW